MIHVKRARLRMTNWCEEGTYHKSLLTVFRPTYEANP